MLLRKIFQLIFFKQAQVLFRLSIDVDYPRHCSLRSLLIWVMRVGCPVADFNTTLKIMHQIAVEWLLPIIPRPDLIFALLACLRNPSRMTTPPETIKQNLPT